MNFICTTFACLQQYLGIGGITISDGMHFIYQSQNGIYYCTQQQQIYRCNQSYGLYQVGLELRY